MKYYAIEIITTLKSLGWTTTKIAKAINMSREHISCIHNGKYVAGKEATEKLKKLMEVAIANNQQITEIKSQIATSDICRECKGKALAIIESAKPQS